MEIDSIKEIKITLERFVSLDDIDENAVCVHLKKLSDVSLSQDALRETRIGVTVNNLLKSQSASCLIKNECRTILKRWRSDFRKSSLDNHDSKSNSIDNEPDAVSVSSDQKSIKIECEEEIKAPFAKEAVEIKGKPETGGALEEVTRPRKRTLSNVSSAAPHLGSVREGYKNVILKALSSYDNDQDELAIEIEKEVFKVCKFEVSQKYKNLIRSRASNLRDKRNDFLLSAVISGTVSPARLASMTHQEMASEEMRDYIKRVSEETTYEHFLGESSGTPTDMFQCSRCKQRKCLYNQAQILRSDEPMTTFVVCTACGNRWKFI